MAPDIAITKTNSPPQIFHFCPKCGEDIKRNGNVVDDGIVDCKKA